MPSDRIANSAMIIAAASCLIAVGLLIRREFRPTTPSLQNPWSTPATKIGNWDQISYGGHRLGPPSAAVTIVEFADFQCPFCAKFAQNVIPAIRKRYPDSVVLVFRHWPLGYHKFASEAAIAAECAAEQGQFERFHNALYQHQDSLGTRPFVRVAHESGVPDTVMFTRCTGSQKALLAVGRDSAFAIAAGAKGTPALAVNGYLLPSVPDSAKLDQIITAALSGKKNWIRSIIE